MLLHLYRFPILRTGIRLADTLRAAKIARVPFILHNLCKDFSDADDFERDDDEEEEEERPVPIPSDTIPSNDRRRNELLRFFE